ncbi:MAG: lysophospholipid acyltransferase family protein [Candidatus Atribacteria bacterium]|nr:lysophospholipid acyltransferase family protein [Candidatus Atribacteria bacterium]
MHPVPAKEASKSQHLGKTPLWSFAKFILPIYFYWRYPLLIEGSFPKPPFLILSHHVNALDPFFIGTLCPYPVSWVANRLIFQHPLLGPLIRAVRAIPKQKNRPDPQMINAVFGVLERGGVVGLFPEGTISWDGNTQKMIMGTDKLLERIAVPVVVVHIKGGWLSKPRWADHPRRGPVTVEIITVDSSHALDTLSYSEWTWQREHMIPFRGRNKACGCERVIWFCPACLSFRAISGKGDTISCQHCGKKWRIDDLGFIDGQSQPEFFGDQGTLLWHYFCQQGRLEIPHVLVSFRYYRTARIQSIQRGILIIDSEGIHIGKTHFLLSRIKSENTFLRKILEFVYDNSLIRIHSVSSSFLIDTCINKMNRENTENKNSVVKAGEFTFQRFEK